MSSINNRDLLTAFSPGSNYFAISSGDGRIKIWDTVKGQLQTEFADISASDQLGLLSETKRGHLSLDYTCMKWVQLESTKKRRVGNSLLVLGTGSGDILSLDVSAGQLKWKVNDCHPGGVTAIAYAPTRSCVYTAGADGMVCKIDAISGAILEKFKASSKSISALSISPDGKILATAAGQLRTFNLSNNKKLQKFSGHPVSVRYIAFTEDGSHLLSSGAGEKSIAIWNLSSGSQSASCLLSVNNPIIFLDSKAGIDESGISILAVSESGISYFWQGLSIEDLRDKKPTRIESGGDRGDLGIFGARFCGEGQVAVAYSSVVKPSFERATVTYGTNLRLEPSRTGFLLPVRNYDDSEKNEDLKTKVTALDRANAEDAIIPLPKIYSHEKKRKHILTDPGLDFKPVTNKKGEKITVKDEAICIEDRMRELGLLGTKFDLNSKIGTFGLSIDANLNMKKIRAQILSVSSDDACNLFDDLVSAWKTRSASSNNILQWIYCLLVKHGRVILSHKSSSKSLDTLQKWIEKKSGSTQDLLRLSGRLQLIRTQIDLAGKDVAKLDKDEIMKEASDDENESESDEEIDEMVYGEEEEDESQSD
ncbi:hypothetical protein LUZ60_013896 [Juncus effusus]|nr:hypothetical protein LUZ60_013896 [Juncus effusus]